MDRSEMTYLQAREEHLAVMPCQNSDQRMCIKGKHEPPTSLRTTAILHPTPVRPTRELYVMLIIRYPL